MGEDSSQLRGRMPENVKTASLVPMYHPTDPKVFAFGVCFPGGLSLIIESRIPTGTLLHSSVCRQYAERVITELQKRNRFDLIGSTNWPSFMAAVQRLSIDFNSNRADAMDGAALMLN